MIGGIFLPVKFIASSVTVPQVKAFGWIRCVRWTPCACCYGTTGVLLWESADSVIHWVLSPVVFICSNRGLKLLFSGILSTHCAF